MINTLKGKLSAKLLGATSDRLIHQISLWGAVTISVGLATLCFAFAFAQWRVVEGIVGLQRQQAAEMLDLVKETSEMLAHQSNAHRATLNCLLSMDEQEMTEADALRRSHLERYLALVSRHKGAETPRNLAQQYAAKSQKIVDLFRAGQKEEAIHLRIAELRPLFNEWQNAQNSLNDSMATWDTQQQSTFDHGIASMKFLLAVLIMVPVLLIFAGAAPIAGLLLLTKLRKINGDSWSH